MIRNFLGVLFLIASGFFVYMVGLLAFFEFPDIGTKKFLLMGGFCVPILLFHLIGLAFYRGANWKVSTGITFISGGAFNIFVVISIISIKNSPEIHEVMDMSGLNSFNDYLSGFIVMALSIGLGFILYLLGRSANKSRQSDASAVA